MENSLKKPVFLIMIIPQIRNKQTEKVNHENDFGSN